MIPFTAKLLSSHFFYGRDIDIAVIANEYPSLHDFLKKLKEIHTIELDIPWVSVSYKRKGLLAKVARKLE